MAMELSLQNPNLLGDRKLLLEAARKKLDESGYSYRKGKSRSKRLNSDGDGSSVSKRAKINAEYRLSRIDELKDKIKDLSEQLHYKNLRRVAAENVHNYKECDKLIEQMSTLKHERHTLELELTHNGWRARLLHVTRSRCACTRLLRADGSISAFTRGGGL